MKPRHPIYIPSKGRHETRHTAKALDAMGVPYRLVVEEKEADAYRAAVGKARVLVLDPAYQRDYDTGDLLGDAKTKGSGPARNFIWDHAQAEGHTHHWTVDDNIAGFCLYNRDKKVPVLDGGIFRAMEDFVARYVNVAMAGPTYRQFARPYLPVFQPNTRIYSCNLIRTDVPYRWRCRYNEDTDLSLRLLKDGWCTVLFNGFLQNKIVTQGLKGGNTDELYKSGTLAKSKMMAGHHPDVTKVIWRFGRWHHFIDYSKFKANRLIPRPGLKVKAGVNDYGIKLAGVKKRLRSAGT